MLASKIESIDQWDGANVTIPKDSSDKIKSSEGLGI